MRLKYIIATLAAAAALFTGCQEEGDTYFDEIRVDSSYVGIPMAGGTREITIKATDDWAFVQDEIPDWLTISPLSGSYGEFKVKFSADETLDGRNAELQIKCANRVQRINVIQGLATVSEATVADVMGGPEKKYRVTGVVTRIHGAHYGNMYINDGTVEDPGLQIYGTLDKKGNKMEKSTAYDCFNSGHENAWEISVGDKVTVEGPMSIYQGAAELVDVTIIKIEKALVKVEPLEIELDGPAAGDTLIKIASKAENVKITPNDSWLYVKEIENTPDTVYARIGFMANEGVVKREGSVSVTGKGFNDVTISFIQGANAPGLMTIAEALQGSYVHVKGTVMAICNRGYVLSDATGSLLVYYGSAFKSENYKLGDEIEIISDISAYNYGPQLSCDGKPGFDLEEKLSEGSGSVTYPTPKVIDQEALAALVASISGKDGKKVSDAITMEYVQITATPKQSGSYTNIFLDGYDAADFSAYQLPASFNLASMLEKKVTIRGYVQSISGGKHVNIVFTEMVEGEAEVPTIEYTDLSTINALAAGTDFELTAVVAVTPKADVAIVTDGTNAFYLYKPSPMPAVGDIVTAKGKISIYNKLIESAQDVAVTVVESGAAVPELTPKDITSTYGSFLDVNQPAQLISAVGQYVVDGSYTNLVVGDNTIKGSLSGAIDAAYNGKTVKVTGWYTGSNKSSSFIYTYVTKVEEQ